MPARPLSTFASEGWYRPSSGRSEHYFRPNAYRQQPLASLCDHWASSEEIRPHLTPGVLRRACVDCSKKLIAMIWAPQSEGWFPDADEQGSNAAPTVEELSQLISEAVSEQTRLAPWEARPAARAVLARFGRGDNRV